MFNRLTEKPHFFQGLLCMVLGIMGLLYAFGIMQKAMTLIVVLSALVLIFVGAVKVGLYDAVVKQIHHKR